jgi:membrane protease YdiL (CAAX protease family)
MGNKFIFVLKTILAGFLVSTLGIALWSADIRLFGLSPISIAGMLIPLWIYWKFFSGEWIKGKWTSRAVLFRNNQMPAVIMKWSLLAGLLFVMIVQSSFVITFRMIELPESFSSQYTIIDTLPFGTALFSIAMASLVAGVCEEVGFRGFMQVPLEKKFGPAFAIGVTSIIFSLAHLDRSWAITIMPVIFFAGILLGVLAYQAQSLVPGIIGHTILDMFDYSLWWTKLFGRFEWKTISETGLDAHFITWLLIFAASLLVFVLAIVKIRNARRISGHSPTGS